MEEHPNIKKPRRRLGNVYFIECVGFIDASNKDALQDVIDDLFENGMSRIVLDFKALDYMASAGANVIIGSIDRARNSGGDLLVLSPGENVLTVLEMIGLDLEVNIALAEGAALRYFKDLDRKNDPASENHNREKQDPGEKKENASD